MAARTIANDSKDEINNSRKGNFNARKVPKVYKTTVAIMILKTGTSNNQFWIFTNIFLF